MNMGCPNVHINLLLPIPWEGLASALYGNLSLNVMYSVSFCPAGPVPVCPACTHVICHGFPLTLLSPSIHLECSTLVCVYACACVYICVHAQTSGCACACECVCIYMCSCTDGWMCTCMHVCMCVRSEVDAGWHSSGSETEWNHWFFTTKTGQSSEPIKARIGVSETETGVRMGCEQSLQG